MNTEATVQPFFPPAGVCDSSGLRVTLDDLLAVFNLKYRRTPQLGWGPRTRLERGYFTPDEYYEAVVRRLVVDGADWVDIGCGRDIFPQNPALARELAAKCGRLLGIDPDPNVRDNPFIKEAHEGPVETAGDKGRFDVVTLRMVAEHIEHPVESLRSIAAMTKPGGHVVVFTPSKWSPVPIVTRLTPFSLHHPVKRWLWGTETRDTFPVQYKMNTRGRLRKLFSDAGFREVFFARLADCRLFAHFPVLNKVELGLWRLCVATGLRYPENCLLGVYQLERVAWTGT